MSNFEFVFSLFSLMLGLALANVLGGLGDALQERRKLNVGVLTPLLALLITIDIASCWTVAWSLRDRFQPTFFSLLCGLAVTGTYYFISRMVVPRNTAEWPDFDDYYWGHKRWILSGQIFCDAAAYAAQMALHENPLVGILDKVLAALGFVGLFAALLVKGRRLNIAMLVGLILLYLVGAVFYQFHIGGGPESGV
ncbi:MAG TPA: hypothetical protein VLI45_00560 [Acidobacteriaceae bacterium]|nr:hypothetical protein [Acidobacteriaceae bacterium]